MGLSASEDLSDLERRFRAPLQAFFLRRVRDKTDAEDLTQEVFVRLARAGETMRSGDAYVFQVAANLVRDRARRFRVREDHRQTVLQNDSGLDVDHFDPHRIAVGREQLASLAAAIAELPDKTRRIFTLYRIENVEKRTIAEGFGLTVRAVEIHLQKAMVCLLDKMDDPL